MGSVAKILLKYVLPMVRKWEWGARKINSYVINKIVSVTRSRPHPWSTKTDYVSWAGLTDRTFSARHLPATDIPELPTSQTAAELFRRLSDSQAKCPKSTMLFPAFAQYLTDGFIRTMVFNDDAGSDRRRTTSNHEIDMCPLYGRNEAQTRALRQMSESRGQRGRLKSQMISNEEWPPFLFDAQGQKKPEFAALDEPLGLNKIPPELCKTIFAVGGDRANANVQVAMLGTLFLREHNRLAAIIETSNPNWDDARVFETTRNVIIVMFIKIVVEEYINHISPAGAVFIADPEVAWAAEWNRPNWITAEFSLLYRWHSLVSDTIAWDGQRIGSDMLRFNNHAMILAGLTKSFGWISAEPAAALGIGNTASFLIDVEQAAIDQARLNRIASYNDYRIAMSLDRASRFEDISSNPVIQNRLKAAYKSVDQLEFYVGMFAEDRVPNSPLPELILTMVAVDAFSQALTNPLLSRHVWGNDKTRQATFTTEGLQAISDTPKLAALVARNTPGGIGNTFIGMTRHDWKLA